VAVGVGLTVSVGVTGTGVAGVVGESVAVGVASAVVGGAVGGAGSVGTGAGVGVPPESAGVGDGDGWHAHNGCGFSCRSAGAACRSAAKLPGAAESPGAAAPAAAAPVADDEPPAPENPRPPEPASALPAQATTSRAANPAAAAAGQTRAGRDPFPGFLRTLPRAGSLFSACPVSGILLRAARRSHLSMIAPRIMLNVPEWGYVRRVLRGERCSPIAASAVEIRSDQA
jgi:hypothetical protein